MSDTAFIAQICLFGVRSEAAGDGNVSINIRTHLWIISLPFSLPEHLAAPPSLPHLSLVNSRSLASAADIRAHPHHFLRVIGKYKSGEVGTGLELQTWVQYHLLAVDSPAPP